MPSPMTMEVPSMAANKSENLAKLLRSRFFLTVDATVLRLPGKSSWKLETSRSSACALGIKPTFAYRHSFEYNAKVPPVTEKEKTHVTLKSSNQIPWLVIIIVNTKREAHYATIILFENNIKHLTSTIFYIHFIVSKRINI